MPHVPHAPTKSLIIPLLMTMTLLGVFPLDVLLPSFPELSEHFHIPPSDVALSVSLFAISLAFSIMLVGPLSDRWGRKRLLLGGIALAAVGASGCVLVTDYRWFLGFRILQALGCGSFSLSQALVQDFFIGRERERLRIWMVTAGGVFISISPLLGTWLQALGGWQSSFYGFITLAAIVWCIACVLIDDVRPARRASEGIFRTYRRLCSNARFVGYWLISALAFACHFSFIVSSPTIFMQRVGLSPQQYAWTLLLYGAAYVMGGMLASVLHRYLRANTQTVLGLGLIAVSGLVMLTLIHRFELSTATVLLPMLLCTLGTTLARPIVNSRAMNVYPQNAGASTSVGAMLIFMFGGVISLVINQMPEDLTTAMALGFLTLSIAALVINALINRTSCRSELRRANRQR